MTDEIWRPVPGWEGYYSISDQGRVRSETRVVEQSDGHRRRVPETVLRQRVRATGHLQVDLRRPGLHETWTVHRLVLLAFVGPPPEEGLHGCHNNGNPGDNRLSNLRWDTVEANHADRVLHGVSNRGERNGSAVLTEDDVRTIRRLRRDGMTQQAIADRYGLARATIGDLLTGRNWSHVAETA